MSDNPISPLRQRMIDDMTARRFSEKVQKAYVRHVRTFAAFLGRSQDTATSDDLRRFQLHMAQQRIGAATVNAAVAALRFFFKVTLERPDLVRPLTIVNKPRKAPVVLSQEEVARLLEAAPGLKYKAALSVAYGAGLRVSEQHLDHANVDVLLEQMRGEAVPQSVRRDALGDARQVLGGVDGAAKLPGGHRVDRVLAGKEPRLRPRRAPPVAQQVERSEERRVGKECRL